jgi:hypothetical protein
VSRVPSDDDYRDAAAFVRSQIAPRDLIVSAPGYIDPIVRLHLGDLMPLAMVGRSDDAAYERVWVLSIDGAIPADVKGKPSFNRSFGRVRVLRYALGKSRVLYDFVQHWSDAEASLTRGGQRRSCRRRSGGVARGGGLGRGVLTPIADRFDCDPADPQLFIGPVVMEDLDNIPRYCVWQHPQGDEPISLRFHDVPLGSELVFYGGIYYEHERMRQGGPVEVTISIDGNARAKFVHHDGEGWKQLRIATAAISGEVGSDTAVRGEVVIQVRASDPSLRSFCWAASTREAPR